LGFRLNDNVVYVPGVSGHSLDDLLAQLQHLAVVGDTGLGQFNTDPEVAQGGTTLAGRTAYGSEGYAASIIRNSSYEVTTKTTTYYVANSASNLAETKARAGHLILNTVDADLLNEVKQKPIQHVVLNKRVVASIVGSQFGYTIQSGDTLSSIAAKYGTTVQALAAINGITDPNKINAGVSLKVPASAAGSGSGSGSNGGGVHYTTNNGYTIAHGTDSYGHSTRSYVNSVGVTVTITTIGGVDFTNYSGGGSSSSRSSSSGGGGSGKPVLLDLDGNGIDITPLSSSNFFFDMAGDGKQHRTAWAAAGDGVLVRDAGDDGIIDQRNEVDFTAWDVTAKSDLEAIKNIFDTDHDGALDSGDDDWSLFKVLVTNDDGTTTLKTLSELGIVSINLTSNNQEIVLSDGSKISGQTTYTKSDSSTGLVGDATLVYDANGYVVDETVTNNMDGSTTVENVASRADGSIASRTTSTTSADGLNREITFDDDGDGVADRVQSIETVVNYDGSTTRTVETYDGSGTILASREVKDTSADGLTITVSSDFDGSGSDDQVETRVTDGSGNLTVTMTKLNDDASTRSETITVASADGHSKTVETDIDGDSVIDATRVETTSIDGYGTRTETVTNYAGDDTLTANRIAETVTVISADGTSRTIDADLDGDGDVDLTTDYDIVHNVDGSTTTTASRYNGDSSLRDRTITDLSADGNTKVTQVDVDGDGYTDLTTSDVKVFNVDGSTTETVEQTYADDSTKTATVSTWSADGKTRSTAIDSDGDGEFDRIQTVAPVSGDSVQTDSIYSPDGTVLLAETVTTTSSDGLTQTAVTDADGDSDADSMTVSTKVVNIDGSSTVTVISKNGAGTVQIGKTVTTTSADGLSVTQEIYLGDDTSPSKTVTDVLVLNVDGSTTETVTTYAGTSEVQVGYAVTETSADKLTQTTGSYIGANEDPASVTTTVIDSDGSRTTTVSRYSPDGATLLGQSVTAISDDGLTVTTTADVDGDADIDGTQVDETTLNTDGTTTKTTTVYAGTGTSHQIAVTTVDTSANGLTVITESDLDGDGDVDAKTVDATVLNADGSTTQTVTSYRGTSNVQVGKTITTVSDDGLTKTGEVYLSDHGTADQVTTDETVLGTDGSTVETVSLYSADDTLLSEIVTTVSGNGLTTTVATDLDGDGIDDRIVDSETDGEGVTTVVVSAYDATGELESTYTTVAEGNGLSATAETDSDSDGDGLVDRTKTSTTTLNADGSRETVVSEYDANSQLLNQTTITTTADGLSVTTEWDGTGGGSASRTQTDVTTVNANGSTTRVISDYDPGTSLHARTTIDTSADGLTVTTTKDIDGDGQVDQTIVQVTNEDGSVTTSNMDGTVISGAGGDYGSASGSYQSTDATGLSTTVDFDADGDGLADSRSVSETVLNTDGSKTTSLTVSSILWESQQGSDPTSKIVTTGRAVTTTSADGLSSDTEWDLDGSGSFDASESVDTVLNANGSATRTNSIYDGVDLVSALSVTASADGMTKTTQRDVDGTGSFTETSTDVLVSNADGSTTETVTNTDASAHLISKFATTTSADGRTIIIQRDPGGTGSYTETETRVTVIHADGSTTETATIVDASSVVQSIVTTLTSADGKTVTTNADADGDGNVDLSGVTKQLVDGSSTADFRMYSADGSLIEQLSSVTSYDGRSIVSKLDLDGDGLVDRSIERTVATNADGSTTDTMKVYQVSNDGVAITPVLLRTTETRTSADGRTTVSTLDVDGDGDVDETATTVTAVDGSMVTTTVNNDDARGYNAWLGNILWTSAIATTFKTIAATVVTTARADGMAKTVEADYDGNGTYEHEETWKYLIDGSQVATIVDRNSAGVTVASGVETISADGLTTTLKVDSDNDGDVDRIETSVVRADGSKVKSVADFNANGST
jgi:LysM repeat protein